MRDATELTDYDTYCAAVHDVLNRLYDSPFLREHPLAAMLASDEREPQVRAQSLRRLILGAIHDMRPGQGAPADSSDWRGYRILELRYVDGLSPADAMRELSLGRSQYYREQKYVLDALCDRLWLLWRSMRGEDESKDPARSRAEMFTSAVDQIAELADWEPIELQQLWSALAPLVEPLARAEGVVLEIVPSGELECIDMDRVLLRQAVLQVLTHAIRLANGGRVEVGCYASDEEFGLQIDVKPSELPQEGPIGIGGDVAQQLMTAMGSVLRVVRQDDGWRVRIAWRPGNPTLLVIDDNESFADLYRRFLAGRGWHVVDAASVRDALQKLGQLRPNVILLDVLMPSADGWELLVELKGREDTRDIPVIVCSVLGQQELALSLGATGYLQKPVTRRELVRVLAPWERLAASLREA